ncbi:Hypothetical predicted protein [Mytilus galloprovincialis]|uniref:Uncharacterized protein n=1 Tax=Mytilus galloprovincialis TaxID=29158 RepID=A0A8B6E5Y2_MYTGA|nr:Hypothetical predicted protein [Mytilus galloprovincialis]
MDETDGVTRCSKEEGKDYKHLTDNNTSEFLSSAIEGINKKTVLCHAEDIEFETENCNCNNVSKTDIQRTKLCLTENEISRNNGMVNIETRYISKEGYFQHTVESEHQKELLSSKCNGRLKFGKRNQLLTLFDEDVTLMPHDDVLVRLRNNMDTKNQFYTGSVEENICATGYISLSSAICGADHYETSGSANKFVMKRMISLNARQTSKFMQIQNGQIAFTELVSSRSFMKVGDFHKSHFIEERFLNQDKTFWLRRYSSEDKENKQYLKITQEGNITLRKDGGSDFQLKCSAKEAYFIVEEMDGKKLLCFNGDNVQFVEYPQSRNDTNYIDCIPEKFRFQVNRVVCNRQ